MHKRIGARMSVYMPSCLYSARTNGGDGSQFLSVSNQSHNPFTPVPMHVQEHFGDGDMTYAFCARGSALCSHLHK